MSGKFSSYTWEKLFNEEFLIPIPILHSYHKNFSFKKLLPRREAKFCQDEQQQIDFAESSYLVV